MLNRTMNPGRGPRERGVCLGGFKDSSGGRNSTLECGDIRASGYRPVHHTTVALSQSSQRGESVGLLQLCVL